MDAAAVVPNLADAPLNICVRDGLKPAFASFFMVDRISVLYGIALQEAQF